jgi:4-hydroxy-tetrahydrodipicolinate synthase
MNEAVRLPMVPLTEPTRVAIRVAMVHAGILNA